VSFASPKPITPSERKLSIIPVGEPNFYIL
jgi:hypothetical protein